MLMVLRTGWSSEGERRASNSCVDGWKHLAMIKYVVTEVGRINGIRWKGRRSRFIGRYGCC